MVRTILQYGLASVIDTVETRITRNVTSAESKHIDSFGVLGQGGREKSVASGDIGWEGRENSVAVFAIRAVGREIA